MKMTLGRYMAYKSPIHKMDPRLKLFMLICLIASIFFSSGFTGLALVLVAIMTLFICSRLPFSMILNTLKPIIFMVVFLFIINCLFFNKIDYAAIDAGTTTLKEQEEPLGNYWQVRGYFVNFSERSAFISLFMGLRIFSIIMITTILTATTQPLDLTLALEDLMSPLKLIRFPVHIFSIIISIALRMIPTLIEEAERIMKAQASRGVDFRHGKIREKTKSLASLIVPLLVSAFQKADDLSNAMDARGYDPHEKRTRSRQYRIKFLDVLIFALGIGATVVVIIYWADPTIIPIPQIPHIDRFAIS